MEVGGQLAVMAVNALLSKLMFEKNPDREFFVEESFPLEWMYPHLSPHGLIMKINRRPITELSSEVVQEDREYWIRFATGLIGDWLTNETSLEEVLKFVDEVYRRREPTGYKLDREYLQNECVQRSFSKLRSSIAGLYAWRVQHSQIPAEKERLLKAADFGFRQAFALAPSSPEAVFRYMSLLLGEHRIDDAISVVQTAVDLETEIKPASKPAHIQEDFSHKPMIESRDNPPKVLTQLGSLLEQLKRMKNRNQ